MRKLNRKSQSGFTIIEVMIVLAIAGLIMLIVFLAVPALQRTSRNTQRKNDVSAFLSGVAEFASNNNGAQPSTTADITAITNNIKLSYYQASNIFVGGTPVVTLSPSTDTPVKDKNTTEEINVYVGYNCPSVQTVAAKAAARSIAVQYVLEAGSGNGTFQCQSS
jgi:prepilin-type N-terminal cleavage/methylation domain-containing protein